MEYVVKYSGHSAPGMVGDGVAWYRSSNSTFWRQLAALKLVAPDSGSQSILRPSSKSALRHRLCRPPT